MSIDRTSRCYHGVNIIELGPGLSKHKSHDSSDSAIMMTGSCSGLFDLHYPQLQLPSVRDGVMFNFNVY